MNTYIPVFHPSYGRAIVLVGAMVGGLLAPNAPVLAQPTPTAPTVAKEITVVAPEVVVEKTNEHGKLGAPIEILSVSHPVRYADLDLTKPAGVAELDKRVRDAATAACNRLETRFAPHDYMPYPPNQDCVRTATESAKPLVRAVIAAAGNQAK